MLCVCRIGSMETTKKWKRHVEKNDAAALNSATVHPYYLVAVLPCSYANPINHHTHPHHQAMELTPDFFTIFASKKYGKTQCYGLHNNSRQHENKKSTQIGPAFQILFLTYRKLLLWYERIFSYSWESQTISQFSPFLSARLTQNHPIKN